MKKVVEHSIENVSKEVSVDEKTFGQPASNDVVDKTVESMTKNNFNVRVVDSAEQALDSLKKLIPSGASVYNGSSTTLMEIGFTDYLKSKDLAWNNLHTPILAEKDRSIQFDMRRQAATADYFISSAQAITQDGEILGCDASGSRVGAWLFTAKNLVIVAGTNKLVPDMKSAMERLYDYALKLESVRSQKVYGAPSNVSKIAILRREFLPRTTVILVNEALGY